ncbi:MAG: PfkB family carbohydrate kinase [Bacteroidales bacterium]|jgi:rfaE bifunctional protein kinase chain/domain|nr:PfkB family carbohydrate kinase [Bacteroidales bacterium]
MDSLLNSFQNTTVLIVGDVMIDCYLRGKVTRISPEAPVPIVSMQQRENRLGGAANVALNVKALGANPILCSVIGNDGKIEMLTEELIKQRISEHIFIEEDSRKTTVKYRVIGNQVQMLRVDDEDTKSISPESERQVVEAIRHIVTHKKVDALIFVDYDKGMLTATLIKTVVELCRQYDIITAVDPKKNNFHHYQDVTLFKPNRKEFQEGVGITDHTSSLHELEEEMRKFAIKQNIDYVMTTLSEEGVAIYKQHSDLFIHQPAYQRAISDVSGAGDTVISVVTLALRQEVPLSIMAQLANLGGGVVCEHAGVVPLTANMLKEEFCKRKGSCNI